MNISAIKDFIKINLKNGSIPMLLGEPGIGKSSWIIELANELNTQCFILPCNQLADKADLTGARLVPDEKGNYKQMFYPHNVIAESIDYAIEHPDENPILFLDEINRTTSDVTSAVLSIPTLRAVGSVKLPDNLRVIIAGNNKGNIIALDEASISRFVLYEIKPDTNTFLDVNLNVNKYIKNVLMKNPDVIFCKEEVKITSNDDENEDVAIDDYFDDIEVMRQITTPRTITALSNFLNELDDETLKELLLTTYSDGETEINTLIELIEGHVGKTRFAELLIAEISENVLKISAKSKKAVKKPDVFDELTRCTSYNELEDKINSISNNEKAESLIYCLWDKTTNYADLIQALSQSTEFEKFHIQSLLGVANDLNVQNIETFLNTNSKLANSLAVILESYMP